MRHAVKSERAVQERAEHTVEPTWLKESRRLIEQSHHVLQSAHILLQARQPHLHPMPSRSKG
jgi:hypothetical protein